MNMLAGLQQGIRLRLTLLGQLRVLPRWVLTAAIGVQLLRTVVPAATALATMALVDRLVATGSNGGTGLDAAAVALGWFVLMLLLDQVVDLGSEPLRFLVARHVDGAHRRSVARVACAPVGIAHLEDPVCQDELLLAAGDPDNWTEGTPGPAVWSQLTLIARYVGGLIAAAVIARDSPLVAAFLLASLIVFRSIQRRDFLTVVRAWADGMPYRRRAMYMASLLTGPDAAKEVRVFGFGSWVLDRYLAESHGHLQPFRAAKLADARRQWVWLTVVLVALASTVYLLGDLAIRGEISIGRLIGDLTAAAFMVPMFSVSPAMLEVEGGLPRLAALLRLRRDVARTDGAPPADPAPVRLPADQPRPVSDEAPLVRFEGVQFRYPGAHRAVLNGLDLEIRPGEVVALVGLNGAGKTTIIKLLAGLYAPDVGRITVDGVDLCDLGADHWRRRLAVVFQDFLRYELPVRENIAMGRPGSGGDDVVAAAVDAAGITDLVRSLPQGWDTQLSPTRDGGVDLSGGQWQRVALARALYAVQRGARFLVLDEPTAHLDVRTEFEVFHQVIRAARGLSVVLISHRLSTVREADRIVLVADGQIVENGSHEELLAAGGQYARLFRLQASQFTDDQPGGDDPDQPGGDDAPTAAGGVR
jgi:ATP-binding cassette subfamily B protein